MTMKAFSSSSIVAAIIENTCAVLLKLLKACHRHLLHPSGENLDSRRCMHAREDGREGNTSIGVGKAAGGKTKRSSPKRGHENMFFLLK